MINSIESTGPNSDPRKDRDIVQPVKPSPAVNNERRERSPEQRVEDIVDIKDSVILSRETLERNLAALELLHEEDHTDMEVRRAMDEVAAQLRELNGSK